MKNAGVVRGVEAIEYLQQHQLGLVNRERSTRQPLGQRLAANEFHRQEIQLAPVAVKLSKVEHSTNVRMRYAPANLNLLPKLLHHSVVGNQRLGQNFEGHGLAELPVVRLVDLPHAASSQKANDFESVCQDIALCQNAGGEVRGRRFQERACVRVVVQQAFQIGRQFRFFALQLLKCGGTVQFGQAHRCPE